MLSILPNVPIYSRDDVERINLDEENCRSTFQKNDKS